MSDPSAARSFASLAGRREQQAAQLKELNSQQAAYESTRAAAAAEPADGHTASALAHQQERLREAYQRAYTSAAEELRLVHDSLHHIRTILKRRDRRAMEVDEGGGYLEEEGAASHPVPSSLGQDRLNIWLHDANRPLAVGSEVAALVDPHSIPPLWIQCAIKGYRPGPRPKYEVIDLDPGDPSEVPSADGMPGPPRQKRYVLDSKKILPLPSLDEVPLTSRYEFQKGERVIAVFPTSGITTLYPAEVILPPKKRKNATYLLKFDDDEDNHRSVSAQYVAPLLEDEQDDS